MAVYHAVWMQNVGAAWLMMTLAASPLMVALVQTASTLPAFLLGLPGGVLADIVDRRKLLLVSLGSLVVTSLALVTLNMTGLISPWLLLFLTFSVGAGTALLAPSWISTQVETVPPQLIPAALGLGSMSFNISRAVGPALAGLIIPLAGIEAVFGLVAVGFLSALLCVLNGSRRIQAVAPARRESPVDALVGIFRYSRHSPVIRHQVLRTMTFVIAASALWALLPLIARYQFEQGARIYGYLLGSLGVGAVIGALVSPVLMEYISANVLVAVAIAAFSVVMSLVGELNNLLLMIPGLFLAGMAWQLVANFNFSAIQTSVPAWIRGRSMSVYLLVFQGSMAAGAAVWGAVAEHAGLAIALWGAAGALLFALVAALAAPARLGDAEAISTAPQPLPEQPPEGINPDTGPLVVETEFLIRPEDRAAFLELIRSVGEARLRDGADSWRLSVEEGRECRCRFELRTASWMALRSQLGRRTLEDVGVERRLYSYHVGPAEPATRFRADSTTSPA